LHAQHKNEQNIVILNVKIADYLALKRLLVDFVSVKRWLSMVIRFVSPLYHIFLKMFASDQFGTNMSLYIWTVSYIAYLCKVGTSITQNEFNYYYEKIKFIACDKIFMKNVSYLYFEF
jgi:hypothetical protein